MVSIHIEDGLATFRIAGLHKLWALKSRIVVPVQDIAAVAGAEAAPRRPGWRIAGTWMPGLITAVTFRQDARWTFWDVAQPEAAIVVTLRGHWYSQLIIEVARPAEARELLTHAIACSHASPAGPATGAWSSSPGAATSPPSIRSRAFGCTATDRSH
jgi:hypothetical protein